jgi:4-hydroxybenzoate polyprenyltransferase
MSRFFALSRTAHGVLDMAAPAFCALLWLGGFPAWQTILLSLFTAFAAYTAVYALNDLLGIKCDREKFARAENNPGYAVEGSAQRHPLAQNLLSVRSGVIWTGAWFGLALIGSYVLNPAIVLVLLVAAALEAIYCQLLTVTPLKTLVSGLVKSSGPMAAILVVDASPAPYSLLLVFAWVFLWEIGGQNIPSDWNYTEEDERADAKTIPIRYGLENAGAILLAALVLTVIISGFLPLVSPAGLGWPYVLLSLLIGVYLLLLPGFRLRRLKGPADARCLFDRASYYPLAHFALISIFVVADMLRVA